MKIKKSLILSVVFLLSWNTGWAADEQSTEQAFSMKANSSNPDSVFTIASFYIGFANRDRTNDNSENTTSNSAIDNNTLRYSSSQGTVVIDSLGGWLQLNRSGEDTVFVKSSVDGALITQFVVRVASEPGLSEQPIHSDKLAWIKMYGIVAIAVVSLTLLIMSYIKSGRRKRKIERLYKERNDLRERNIRLECSVHDKDRELTSQKQRLDNTNQELRGEISKMQQQSRRIEVTPTPLESNIRSIAKSNKLYAASINDGYFYRITEEPNDDTIFEITKDDDRNAKFTVYPAVYERVKARPSSLEGCDVQKLNSNPNTLDVEQGSAKKEDGEWKIITKAKVKFV